MIKWTQISYKNVHKWRLGRSLAPSFIFISNSLLLLIAIVHVAQLNDV